MVISMIGRAIMFTTLFLFLLSIPIALGGYVGANIQTVDVFGDGSVVVDWVGTNRVQDSFWYVFNQVNEILDGLVLDIPTIPSISILPQYESAWFFDILNFLVSVVNNLFTILNVLITLANSVQKVVNSIFSFLTCCTAYVNVIIFGS